VVSDVGSGQARSVTQLWFRVFFLLCPHLEDVHGGVLVIWADPLLYEDALVEISSQTTQ
jgi:hypothetical protein